MSEVVVSSVSSTDPPEPVPIPKGSTVTAASSETTSDSRGRMVVEETSAPKETDTIG